MHIVKPLHLTPLFRTFSYRGQAVFACGAVAGFALRTGEPVLEMALWKAVAERLGQGAVFDAAMPKRHPEVLVHGRFHAPGGTPVSAGKVGLTIGPLHKELMVFGERFWRRGLPSAPQPFSEMPLDYAHAFGGPGHDANPTGKGMAAEAGPDGEARLPLPNIEDPHALLAAPGDRPPPAGFGPLDQTWAPRAQLRGTYDERWLRERAPGLADDLDWSFFNDAPKDQWLDDSWRGDEPFLLAHMHPQAPELRGRLPGWRARCFLELQRDGAARFEELPLVLETVHLFPDQDLGALIFRGTTGIAAEDLAQIAKLLLAFENQGDAPRAVEHYREEMRKRTDPEELYKHVFNTGPLIPHGCVCGFEAVQGQAGPPLENLGLQNGQRGADKARAEAEAQAAQVRTQVVERFTAAGIDPAPQLAKMEQPATDPRMSEIQAMIDKAMPGAREGKLDLTRLDLKLLDEAFKRLEALGQEQKAAGLAAAEQALREVAATGQVDPQLIEARLVALHAPPPLPRPQGAETLAAVQTQMAELNRTLDERRTHLPPGVELPRVAPELGAMEAQLSHADEQFLPTYRQAAHLMPTGAPPHLGREAARAQELLERFRRGESLAGGDFAGVSLAGADLRGIDLRNAYLEDVDLSGASLEGACLAGAVLARARLVGANLRRAALQGTNLGATDLSHADFSGADLTGAILGRAHLAATRFEGAILNDAQWLEARFAGVDLSGAQLPKATFIDADLSGCRLRGANLAGATFIKPQLAQADLSGALLDETTWVECRAPRSLWSGASLQNARFVNRADLSDSDFTEARLLRANFDGANLSGANLSGAELGMAWFGGAALTRARLNDVVAQRSAFVNADLEEADLDRANLMEASMHGARLVRASLCGCNLYAVDFFGATLGETAFTASYLERTLLRDWRPA